MFQASIFTATFFNFLFVAKLSEGEIEDYLDKKEPYDKAGAYAIQGYVTEKDGYRYPSFFM